MLVLDTNVLSALMRLAPDPVVIRWLDEFSADVFWTTAITVFEIRFGLDLLGPSRRRRELDQAFARALEDDLEGRVLPFDRAAALASGTLAAAQRKTGRTIEIRDVQIAGVAASRRAILATRNTRHFEGLGLALANPWSGLTG